MTFPTDQAETILGHVLGLLHTHSRDAGVAALAQALRYEREQALREAIRVVFDADGTLDAHARLMALLETS